jgi:hypothetical protein
MKKKNLPIFKIPKDLKQEIEMFCELNNIENENDVILGCLKGGFAIEKFGRTPIKAGKEIIEKEIKKEVIKEIEKIVEVPVEKIIEKIIEVPVEKIIEIEKLVTDDTQLKEYSLKVNSLTIEKERLTEEVTEWEKKFKEWEKKEITLLNFTDDNQGLKEEIKKLKEKIEEYEGILNHFRRFSGTNAIHLKSSRLNDELYKD